MLYDIMPPVIFLGSLGGIVWIISRVSARIRRTAISASLSSVVTEDSGVSTATIQPMQSRINLLSNRWEGLSGWLLNAKSSLPVIRQAVGKPFGIAMSWWKKRREEKAEKMLTMQEEAVSLATPEPVVPPKPAITLRKIEQKEEQPMVSAKQVTSPKFFQKKPVVSVLEQAQQALAQAEYDQAENILVPYIFAHTKDTSAYMLLGRVAFAKSNWEEAIEIFEQVIKRNSKETGAWALLGEAAYKSGHFTRALQTLQRAHEADPTDIRVLELLMSIARKMDNRGLQESIQEKLSEVTSPDAVHV